MGVSRQALRACYRSIVAPCLNRESPMRAVYPRFSATCQAPPGGGIRPIRGPTRGHVGCTWNGQTPTERRQARV